MIHDPWGDLARKRPEELLSLAAELAQARRAREAARALGRRPLHLPWLAILLGPR